jgi:2,3-bisphosphoglycerate-dependent phosphoglycerate mutase
MKLFLVRHGQSQHNAAGLRQNKDDQLSEKGIEQAHFVASRFTEVPIDRFYASNFIRARQTAEIISEKINKSIEFTDLLCERKSPSVTEGKNWKDPEVVKITQETITHVNDPQWHHSDEENFFDFRNRALRFLELVESREDQNVLVVTHGGFMVMLLLVMKYRDKLLPSLYLELSEFIYSHNSGITVCDNSYDGNWWLITWNDHGHLGYFYP